jgi:hypothetical protein
VFKWLEQKFCRHHFKLLTTYKTDVDETLGYDLREMYIIYCPHCKKEQIVVDIDYNRIMARQKVDEEYVERKRNN